MEYNLITVYTNHKFINEYTYLEKNKFIINLLNCETLIDKNNIWKIEIITINPNKTFNYNCIENTSYKISLDNTHILDKNNNILKYKLDKYDRQFIEITDKNFKDINIYYNYIEQINNSLFQGFTNYLKDIDCKSELSLEYQKEIYDDNLLLDSKIDLDLNFDLKYSNIAWENEVKQGLQRVHLPCPYLHPVCRQPDTPLLLSMTHEQSR